MNSRAVSEMASLYRLPAQVSKVELSNTRGRLTKVEMLNTLIILLTSSVSYKFKYTHGLSVLVKLSQKDFPSASIFSAGHNSKTAPFCLNLRISSSC